ncbi:MAG: hypothetical protein IID51_13210 [Proteobacteria bacterium]|nr:hypothetical protein [Pseudomonadota bacterium]
MIHNIIATGLALAFLSGCDNAGSEQAPIDQSGPEWLVHIIDPDPDNQGPDGVRLADVNKDGRADRYEIRLLLVDLINLVGSLAYRLTGENVVLRSVDHRSGQVTHSYPTYTNVTWYREGVEVPAAHPGVLGSRRSVAHEPHHAKPSESQPLQER